MKYTNVKEDWFEAVTVVREWGQRESSHTEARATWLESPMCSREGASRFIIGLPRCRADRKEGERRLKCCHNSKHYTPKGEVEFFITIHFRLTDI